jgi:lipid II:glycine glycyltransferase (peptidoglycan interpeptide bridge formation enzyme)
LAQRHKILAILPEPAISLHEITSASQWDTLVQTLAGEIFGGASYLQSWQWGELKNRWGWRASRLAWQVDSRWVAACQVLLRDEGKFGLRLRVAYAPRGPLLNWQNDTLSYTVLASLRHWAKQKGAFVLKVDPEAMLGWGVPDSADDQPQPSGSALQAHLTQHGWHDSPFQIQFRNSMWLNLQTDAESLIQSFKQKTRYNIRLAERKGVQVRQAQLTDLPHLFDLYAETAQRDGFVIRSRAYYLDVWQTLLESGSGVALLAEVDGQWVAGVVLTRSAGRVTYMYGMSRTQFREWMPTYLLQWRAIEYAQQQGCHTYDFWGAPEVFAESDSMWGVWRFKEGFRGQVVRTLGAWDAPIQPLLYAAYTQLMPRLLAWMKGRAAGQSASN